MPWGSELEPKERIIGGRGFEAIKIISICFSLLSVAGTNTMTKSNSGGNDLFDLHSHVTIHH